MASSWFSTLECCFPQLSHAQRLAKLKAAQDNAVHLFDDDSSTYSDSDSSDYSSSTDVDETETEDDFQQQRLLLTIGNKAGGVFVSDAAMNVLRSNLQDMDSAQHSTAAISAATRNVIMRRGSETDHKSPVCAMDANACVQTHFPTKTFSEPAREEQDLLRPQISPSEKLKQMLQTRGITFTSRASKDLQDFFFLSKQEHIDAYNNEVMNAVRSSNVDELRDMLHQGKQLQCCNKFYESILHAAARRGGAVVMDFLLHEAELELRVCCASGRNPLHDACWTTSPDFQCIKIILQECPDLLLIADHRNFTPLAYVPKDVWADWVAFLEANEDLLTFKELL